jgi:hypothetical protein
MDNDKDLNDFLDKNRGILSIVVFWSAAMAALWAVSCALWD